MPEESELMELAGIVSALPDARYVRVVPESTFERCLDYVLPAEWSASVLLGHRLRVPWGKKETLAYVVDFPERPASRSCREALALVGDEPLIPPVLIRLARWMAGYYCCEMTMALKGMLPELLRSRPKAFKEQIWVHPRVDSMVGLEIPKKARSQALALEAAIACGGNWMAVLCKETRTTPATWRAMETRGWVLLETRHKERDPFTSATPPDAGNLTLSNEQQAALKALLSERASPTMRPMLLQGVTGSGKTEVYLQLIESVLSSGQSALVLVPEISLTPQTVSRFRSRFEGAGVGIAVLHSHLSAGERHDQWQRIRQGAARIVIGARSAVFAPLTHLGVIIVDEEHEQSFKQDDSPRYHARDVAVMRGLWEKALVVLGSATPSLETARHVRSEKYGCCRLTQRTDRSRLPVIHVVDLRKQGSRGIDTFQISQPLAEAIRLRLKNQEQTILFLNRRGFSTSLQCPHCGHVFECSSCSIPLTYHRKDGALRCHLCDHEEEPPTTCPSCGARDFKYSGVGTQRIEEAVARTFPDARWQRMDSDSMRGKHAYEEALERFRNGDIDILIGTQMITKGLDFPQVTCVGIINVDGALQMPDFRSAERVFQQLVQVSGRAGRGEKPGEVYLQTYAPFHPAIQFARHHDVDGFIDHEIEFREVQGFPPFRRCAVVWVRGHDRDKTEYCAGLIAKKLRGAEGVEEKEPLAVPAPIERIRNQFRYQIICFTSRMPLLSRTLMEKVVSERWPEGIAVSVDIDAFQLM
ncbi:MAG: primosomal protein N' [Candidatus Methylacidiphilales bacterium]